MRKFLTLFFLCVLNYVSFSQEPVVNIPPEQKFQRVLNIIKYNYVDTVNFQKAVEHAIIGMLEHLDPHSVYMDAEEVKRANEPLQGSFEGIGVQFQIIRDTINVIASIPGGPAEQVGIMAGDKIVTIDGEDAVGTKINNEYVMKRLRGPKGTKVKVGIIRYPSKNIVEFEIIRDKIPLHSLDAAFMIDNEIGYIKINRFASTTLDEFQEGIKKLKEKKLKYLILDLRGNSGGYLKTAVELADQFLDKDKLIVYTEGHNQKPEKYYSTSKGEFIKGRLVILVDQGSASASEIVSGAVQDWDRGLIVGRRTFGKGLVQKPFQLPDGSVIRLTTARYYTPTGRCIQKPYTDDKDAYLREVNERLKKGELVHPEKLNLPDSLKYTTPRGRTVYGGGGIIPDIFVPLDTTRLDEYYSTVLRKNMFNQFIADYLQTHRKLLLSTYPDISSFKSKFLPNSENLYNEFIEYNKKFGIEPKDIGEKTKHFMKYLLSAYLARNLYEHQAFYEIFMFVDDDLQKAIEVIKNEKAFRGLDY